MRFLAVLPRPVDGNSERDLYELRLLLLDVGDRRGVSGNKLQGVLSVDVEPHPAVDPRLQLTNECEFARSRPSSPSSCGDRNRVRARGEERIFVSIARR